MPSNCHFKFHCIYCKARSRGVSLLEITIDSSERLHFFWPSQNDTTLHSRGDCVCSFARACSFKIQNSHVKSPKYWFDLDAVRVPAQTAGKSYFNVRVRRAGGRQSGADPQAVATPSEIGAYREGEGRAEDTEPTAAESLATDAAGIACWKQPADRGQQAKNLRVPRARSGGAHSMHARRAAGRGEVGAHPRGKNPGDILRLTIQPLPYDHFASFPEKLPEFIIRCACPPGGLVFDPFLGAGTTAVAARRLGRKYAGIEINSDYVEIARDRLGKVRAVKSDATPYM